MWGTMIWIAATIAWIVIAVLGCAVALRNYRQRHTVVVKDWKQPDKPRYLDDEQVRFILMSKLCPYCKSKMHFMPTEGRDMHYFCSRLSCDSKFTISIPAVEMTSPGALTPLPVLGKFLGGKNA